MIRFIVRVNDSDGYTYVCDKMFPVIAESVEDVYCQIHDQWLQKKDEWPAFIKIGKQEIDIDYFKDERGQFITPQIMSVDEFFTQVE